MCIEHFEICILQLKFYLGFCWFFNDGHVLDLRSEIVAVRRRMNIRNLDL